MYLEYVGCGQLGLATGILASDGPSIPWILVEALSVTAWAECNQSLSGSLYRLDLFAVIVPVSPIKNKIYVHVSEGKIPNDQRADFLQKIG